MFNAYLAGVPFVSKLPRLFDSIECYYMLLNVLFRFVAVMKYTGHIFNLSFENTMI